MSGQSEFGTKSIKSLCGEQGTDHLAESRVGEWASGRGLMPHRQASGQVSASRRLDATICYMGVDQMTVLVCSSSSVL